jgi:hypothetical protein
MPAQTKAAKSGPSIAVIDIGKNVFHLIGLDGRGLQNQALSQPA